MIEDNLTKEKLLGFIGSKRFKDEEEFKDFLKPHIKEILAIPKERMGEESALTTSEDNRYDIYIYDKNTLHEILVLIGVKTISKYPKLTANDLEKFHTFCMDAKALYGVLVLENDIRFFQYKETETGIDIIEIKEIPPLNHIDYKAGKKITPEKLMYLALNNKWFLVGAVLFIILLIILNIARSAYCSNSGPIKGNIDSKGVKTYYLPTSKRYTGITVGNATGERRFCSETDAINKGFIKGE